MLKSRSVLKVNESNGNFNKTRVVRINVIFRRVRVTFVAVESNKYYVF